MKGSPPHAGRQLVMLGLLASAAALAQPQAIAPEPGESEVPTPPAFDVKRLLPIEVSRASALTIGIDPATVTITPSGVVRYVVIASSPSGAVNVMYEGIRCASAEYRVYARHHGERGWVSAQGQEWQSLRGSLRAQHPLALARAGVCDGPAPGNSPADIVRALRSPAARHLD